MGNGVQRPAETFLPSNAGLVNPSRKRENDRQLPTPRGHCHPSSLLLAFSIVPPKLQRLEFLDSIRGLAALAVLLFHCFFILPISPSAERFFDLPFVNIIVDGPAAVLMFFVLSGYLLSRSYFVADRKSEPERRLHIATFYIRRFTRIWMPWFVVFCLSAFARAFLFRPWATVPPETQWFLGFWRSPLTLETLFQQCLFIPQGPGIPVLPQDWTLRLELQASALLPLCLFLCRVFTFWALPALSLLTFICEPTGCYCAFIFGIALAKYGAFFQAAMLPKSLFVKIAILVVGLLFYEEPLIIDKLEWHFWRALHGANGGVSFFIGLGCAMILVSSMSSQRIQNALHLPPMIFLGRISFSVYLMQIVVLFCLTPAWIHWLNKMGIHQLDLLLLLNMAVSVGTTLALSVLSYHWVEKPCINFGHSVSERMRARRSSL
jgi:peptidoglycan/LPS O-acetylase OafA/YrhL